MKIAFDATTLFNFSGIDTYSRELITALVNTSPEISIKLITSETVSYTHLTLPTKRIV